MRFAPLSLIFVLFLSSCSSTSIEPTPMPDNAPAEYSLWLESMKQDMATRGISTKTINEVFAKSYYHPKPEIIKIDRKQLEFTVVSTDYLNRIVNEIRVKKARQKYQELYPLFKDVEEKYGVGFNYLIAFWGIETNFGSTFGNYEVIDALTTLAYDKRRRDFFTTELYNALKIIDTYGIDPAQMEGSWAGAMGHFQFMPSTFNAYAVDYDKDGKIDIWRSYGDAVASAANYLSSIGWEKGQDWGFEVSLPKGFDYSATGRNKRKTVAEWNQLGVRTLKGEKLSLSANTLAALVTPEGKRGKSYLVLNNFHKIMMWNRSENYALAVGRLADYAKSGKPYEKFTSDPEVYVKAMDVLKIQSFINKLGLGKIEEDGKLGSETREAIKSLQKKAKLPEDGYPDKELLKKINNYDPKVGFSIPAKK